MSAVPVIESGPLIQGCGSHPWGLGRWAARPDGPPTGCAGLLFGKWLLRGVCTLAGHGCLCVSVRTHPSEDY